MHGINRLVLLYILCAFYGDQIYNSKVYHVQKGILQLNCEEIEAIFVLRLRYSNRTVTIQISL